MNILKHEIRLYRKSTLIWTVSLVVVLFFFAGIFPAFKDSAAAMSKILESFPDGLKNALGLSTMDLSSALGFFGFMFSYIILIGGVQAMNLGLSILSNEQRDKTADFLMVKPVKRIQIAHAKIGALAVNLIFTNLVFTAFAFVTMAFIAETDFSYTVLALFAGSLFFTQFFFASFGMMLSVFMNKLKTVVPISLGSVFGFFILNMLNESLEGGPLTLFTPFAYFNAGDIYESVSYDVKLVVFNCVLVVAFTVIAYIQYMRKDIPSV